MLNFGGVYNCFIGIQTNSNKGRPPTTRKNEKKHVSIMLMVQKSQTTTVWTYKNHVHNGDIFTISTGEFTGFLNHQQKSLNSPFAFFKVTGRLKNREPTSHLLQLARGLPMLRVSKSCFRGKRIKECRSCHKLPPCFHS